MFSLDGLKSIGKKLALAAGVSAVFGTSLSAKAREANDIQGPEISQASKINSDTRKLTEKTLNPSNIECSRQGLIANTFNRPYQGPLDTEGLMDLTNEAEEVIAESITPPPPPKVKKSGRTTSPPVSSINKPSTVEIENTEPSIQNLEANEASWDNFIDDWSAELNPTTTTTIGSVGVKLNEIENTALEPEVKKAPEDERQSTREALLCLLYGFAMGTAITGAAAAVSVGRKEKNQKISDAPILYKENFLAAMATQEREMGIFHLLTNDPSVSFQDLDGNNASLEVDSSLWNNVLEASQPNQGDMQASYSLQPKETESDALKHGGELADDGWGDTIETLSLELDAKEKAALEASALEEQLKREEAIFNEIKREAQRDAIREAQKKAESQKFHKAHLSLLKRLDDQIEEINIRAIKASEVARIQLKLENEERMRHRQMILNNHIEEEKIFKELKMEAECDRMLSEKEALLEKRQLTLIQLDFLRDCQIELLEHEAALRMANENLSLIVRNINEIQGEKILSYPSSTLGVRRSGELEAFTSKNLKFNEGSLDETKVEGIYTLAMDVGKMYMKAINDSKMDLYVIEIALEQAKKTHAGLNVKKNKASNLIDMNETNDPYKSNRTSTAYHAPLPPQSLALRANA